MHLLQLPVELQTKLLGFLGPISLISCQKTCKSLFNLIQASATLQYSSSLQLSGLIDNPASTLSIPDRLDRLRLREHRWETLHSDFSESIPVNFSPSGIYDLTGGVYLLGDIARRVLHYCTLPSQLDDQETKWNSISVQKTIIDLGLAVYEHDLIAVLTTSVDSNAEPIQQIPHHPPPPSHLIELHLFEFSTGKPHPLANQHSIRLVNSPFERPAIGIEIVGDHLVLVMTYFTNPWEPEDQVFVYNWKSGDLMMSFTAPYHTYSGIIFLTPALFLLPNTKRGTLDIFRIIVNTSPNSTMSILNFSDPELSLSLPRLAQGRAIASISCRGEPNPVSPFSTPHLDPARPFYASPQSAIVILNMRILSSYPPPHPQQFIGSHLSLIVHRHALVNAYLTWMKRTSEPDGYDDEDYGDEDDFDSMENYVTVPWAEWGPPVTRWIDTEGVPTRWITTTAGQRCVLISEMATSIAPFPVVVLDFNPINVKKAVHGGAVHGDVRLLSALESLDIHVDGDDMSSDEESAEEGGVQDMDMDADAEMGVDLDTPKSRTWVDTTPSRIDDSGAFEEEGGVWGELGYVGVASMGRWDFQGVLLDEERILGIRTAELDRITGVEVLHFG